MKPAALLALSAVVAPLVAAQSLRVELLGPDNVPAGEPFDIVVRGDFSESGLTEDARLVVFTAFFQTDNATLVGLDPVEPFASASPTFDLDFDDVFGRPAVVLQADEILLTDTGFEIGVPVPSGQADLFVLRAVAGDQGEARVAFVTDELPGLETSLGASGVFVFLTLPDFDVSFAAFDGGDSVAIPSSEVENGATPFNLDQPSGQIDLVGRFSVGVPVLPLGSDIDGSGIVDAFDLAEFLSGFTNGLADYNADGTTDGADLSDLLAVF